MKRLAILVLLLPLFLAIPVSVSADESCKCRRGWVFEGDDMATVLKKCGEPTSRAYAGERSTWHTVRVGRTLHSSGKSVPIERWTYNERSGKFPRIMTFRGGTLYNIRLGDK